MSADRSHLLARRASEGETSGGVVPPSLTLRASVVIAVLVLSGCQQEMATQPSYRPDQASAFFVDGRAARPEMPGTIARGHLRTDHHLFAGRRGESASHRVVPTTIAGLGPENVLALAALLATQYVEDNGVDTFPFPVTARILEHGRNRYMIYCVVCHDPLGTGRGMIVERGYTPPPSYHTDRLRQASVGHFFDVITRGYGSMPSYRNQVPVRDRWAIAAYIRALQLSQHFPERDLPEDMRREWHNQSRPGGLVERGPP